MTDIIIIRNDKNFVLEFTIYTADGDLVDLTNVSEILLKFQAYEDGTVTSITGTVVGSSPLLGQAQFLIGSQFVGITGEFKAEIQITYTSGRVLTAPNIYIKVIADLP